MAENIPDFKTLFRLDGKTALVTGGMFEQLCPKAVGQEPTFLNSQWLTDLAL
jgi:hypothetical protein